MKQIKEIIVAVSGLAARAGAAIAGSRKLTIAAGGAVIALVAVGVWAIWPMQGPPDPTLQAPQEIQQYLASKSFANQGLDAQQKYISKAFQGGRGFRGSGDLTDDQRRQLRQNVRPVMQQMMKDRVDGYFDTPEEDREAYLDKLIDEFRRRRPERSPRTQPTDRQTQPGQGRRGWRRSPDRMKRNLEETPADDRAKQAELWRALRRRMRDRGISGRRNRPGR